MRPKNFKKIIKYKGKDLLCLLSVSGSVSVIC